MMYLLSVFLVVLHFQNVVSFVDKVYLQVGSNVGEHVAERVKILLESINVSVSSVRKNDFNIFDESKDSSQCLWMQLGDISDFSGTSFHTLPAESFAVGLTTRHEHNSTCAYLLKSNGLPLSRDRHNNVSFNILDVHYGAVVGAYAALELIGFSFLHPLQPYRPPHLYTKECNNLKDIDCNYYHHESPYWPERNFHLHTQHPLELVEVLQGHDIPRAGPTGAHCGEFSKPYRGVGKKLSYDQNTKNSFDNKNKDKAVYCERWEDMMDDVDRLFEWAVANRLNKLEWLLLGNHRWENEMDTRFHRLQLITDLGHKYSLLIGADCPIGNQQQHAWYMVNTRSPMSQQFQQIRDRVDWIFGAGFDFLTTESGLSEFTHPECEVMLGILDEFANYVNGTWGREAAIKVHCSPGQFCSNFLDPISGKPINFNFLTMFATPKLGVFPHTIQVYSLDDPTANAYGNQNFSFIEEYMVQEAKWGNRSVVFYGETAYWVRIYSII